MSKIETNKRLAARLGWTPADFGQATIDDALVAKIAAYQAERELTPDGLMGPRTYAVMLTSIIRGALTRPLTLEERGALVTIDAKRRWLGNVRDDKQPRNRLVIDELITGATGLGWSWIKHTGDGSFAWCGAFAAACWATAGLPLMPARYHSFASTNRLEAWRLHSSSAPPSLELTRTSTGAKAVFADGSIPRAGDILLVGENGFGTHIAIAETFNPATGVFTTFEGNAHGVLPDGTRGEGIIRATRPVGDHALVHVRRVIRPGAASFA